MKPFRLRVVEPSEKLGNPDLSPPPRPHRPRVRSHAELDTAKPTDRPAFEQPQNLDPAIALRATEKAPRAAVRELAQREAD
jgi:hypothetical protein